MQRYTANTVPQTSYQSSIQLNKRHNNHADHHHAWRETWNTIFRMWLFIVHGMYSVIYLNATLLWMSVNVFLVVGIWKYYQCKKDAESTERSDCAFRFKSLSFSLSLSLFSRSLSPSLCMSLVFLLCVSSKVCIYFQYVHLFCFLGLADFALGHWGKVVYDIMHSWCYCNDF